MKTLIIAEAGVNHNGNVVLAKQLISTAAAAGADLVKFQSFITSKCISLRAPKAEYQIHGSDPSESQFEMVRKLELSKDDHDVLGAECQMQNIGFFSTGFDIESVDLLASLGQNLFKIPSGEITNLPYLRHIGRLGKPIILSTGMSNMLEIESAIKALEQAGTPRSKITVLHCTTEYPTPMRDVNLRAMKSIQTELGVAIGYSDHTLGIEVAVAAVAMGATVIEKHFTLDRNLSGPDHKASLEPAELKAMVSAIRNIEIALGDDVKQITPSEAKNILVARKSLVASKDIQIGERYSGENLTAKRPGTGISPMRWDEIIGLTANRNYAPDELIQL